MLKNRKIYMILFYSVFTAIWFLGYMYSGVIPHLNIINKILLVIGAVFFLIGWLSEKYTKKEYVIQFLFLGLLGLVFLMSGKEDEGILTIILAIVGTKNLSIKQITKVMFFTMLVLFIILIILTLIQIIPYSTYQKADAFGNTYDTIEIANKHGNSTYLCIFAIEALYLYTYYSKLNIKKCILIQSILIGAYFLFYSRTGFLLGTLTLWGILIIKKMQEKEYKINKILAFLIENSYLLMFLFVYIMGVFFYETSIGEFINKLVTSRLYEANYYITKYGVGLFPKVVDFYICDNAQTFMMVKFGVIYTIIYLVVYYKTMKNLVKRNKYIETFFIIIFLLYSYCEIVFLKPFPNFSILFLMYAFYPNREEENNNEEHTKLLEDMHS